MIRMTHYDDGKGNEYSGQPIDFDLMDESEKPDADIEPIIEAEGAEE